MKKVLITGAMGFVGAVLYTILYVCPTKTPKRIANITASMIKSGIKKILISAALFRNGMMKSVEVLQSVLNKNRKFVSADIIEIKLKFLRYMVRNALTVVRTDTRFLLLTIYITTERLTEKAKSTSVSIAEVCGGFLRELHTGLTYIRFSVATVTTRNIIIL